MCGTKTSWGSIENLLTVILTLQSSLFGGGGDPLAGGPLPFALLNANGMDADTSTYGILPLSF